MLTTNEMRPIYHKDQRLDLYYTYPQNITSKLPAVLIFPPWSGRNHFVEHKANLISQKGYVGIAVDLFGNGRTGETKEECSALITPFVQDRSFLKDRLSAVISAVQQDQMINPDKIMAMGYCFGGLCVLDAVRNNLGICAGISIHGLYGRPDYDLPKTYSAKILTLHGYKDPMIPPQDANSLQQELQDAASDWQMITYGLGYHAFTNPEANDPEFGTVFNSVLDDRTTSYTNDFIKEVLG